MFLKWRANLALTIGENPHLCSALTFIFNYSTSRAATRTLLAAPTGLELLKQTGCSVLLDRIHLHSGKQYSCSSRYV